MRYVVKLFTEGQIKNVFATNNESEAHQKEWELRQIHGVNNVWTADAIEEILVG
jgi:hypothetical protein